ncbi:hypothetical protein Vi05172_g2577 [Venturia inaequalis]|nr:hypothetical protein Vi05172_g2577 [Venturia inaequalis]
MTTTRTTPERKSFLSLPPETRQTIIRLSIQPLSLRSWSHEELWKKTLLEVDHRISDDVNHAYLVSRGKVRPYPGRRCGNWRSRGYTRLSQHDLPGPSTTISNTGALDLLPGVPVTLGFHHQRDQSSYIGNYPASEEAQMPPL